MAIVATSRGGTRTPIPEGSYSAVCTRIIDLGTQFNENFGTSGRKVMICWEIPDVTIEIEGKELPKMISKEYTLSLSKKSNLRPMLEAWRGKAFTDEELNGFDLKNVLGHTCFMQIIHSDKGYERISSIMSCPKGVAKHEPATELLYLDFEDKNFMTVLEKVPEWIRDKVKKSPEYKELVGELSNSLPEFLDVTDDEDLEIPF